MSTHKYNSLEKKNNNKTWELLGEKTCLIRSTAIFKKKKKKKKKERNSRGCFVCVEILRSSQPNGVMLSAVNLPNHTFTGQALSSKRLTSIVHIHSPETDNCPS